MTYAIIATGGKQYRVSVGDTLKVESLEAEVGTQIEFDKVLMYSAKEQDIRVGLPYLEDTRVVGEIISHGRRDKIDVIKFRRRKHYKKKYGHRQNFTEVEIKSIN